MSGNRRPDLDALLDELSEDRQLDERERSFFKAVADAAPTNDEANPFGWARLQRSMNEDKKATRQNWWRSQRVAPWQLAASITAAVCLGFVLPQGQAPDTDEPTYQTAGEEAEAPLTRVLFTQEANQGDITALLLSLDAEIISGPSAIGFYEIAPTDAGAHEDLPKALETSSLVEMVITP